ncbi:hypothetical protein BSL78_03862 [Apostichopus japonicus]|uniref:Short-chain collagen C4-like n=1 Tax=Stichopus japonicus TaxID=307972 RepID=A0A2G8LG45_STIJA|nr:hypothetical protein BSL78_03862 [Apostichopus japonicus]
MVLVTWRLPQRPFLLVPGRDGQPGAPGQRGSPGDRGSKGDRGSTGLPGTIGPNGDIGPKGVKGTEGDSGQRGSKGAKGMQGRIGVQGTKGDSGVSGSGTTSKTHYTRWGSYAAGAYYDQKGGGANYVCLPRNPTYDRPDAGVNTWRAYMYGAEYEVVNFPPFSGLDNGDVPCAVCSVSERSVAFMQPARIDCPDGWTREYYGYLMAQSYIYYRSEWACVDHSATLTHRPLQGIQTALYFIQQKYIVATHYWTTL